MADTNLVAYFWLPGPFSATAAACVRKDRDWAVPPIWRAEMRNVLARYLRAGLLDLSAAQQAMENAERMLHDREQAVPSIEILNLVARSTCSAYDCEFVALAQKLGVKLVTKDAKVLREFPQVAVDLETFAKA